MKTTRKSRHRYVPQIKDTLNVIFHAFSMRYSQIAEIAPKLAQLGFTHVQFPPIQETRVLNELDIELLAKQIQIRDGQLESFAELCKEAKRKEELYSPHHFDYLLQQRIYTIRQPILQYLHKCILEGIHVTELHEFLYNESEEYRYYVSTGTYPYPSELINAAQLVLQLFSVPAKFTEYTELDDINTEYIILQSKIQTITPVIPTNLLDKIRALTGDRRRLMQKKQLWENYIEQLQALISLIPIVTRIRAELHVNEGRISVHKQRKHIKFSKEHVKYWIDCMTVCELLLYPPWWLVYQPIKLAIGDTLLGSKEEIYDAIRVCKSNRLQVIADVVINNLAAVAGEKKSWAPFLKNVTASSKTLSDIVPSDSDKPQVEKIRGLLECAFSTDDLTLLTVPYECGAEQEATHCWMSGALPQLNQEHPAVQSALQTFTDSLKKAGVSGVRIDAAAHIKPHICEKVIRSFNGLSYIEYVGDSAQLYDAVRLEDFAIGEDLYLSIFSGASQTARLVNYGDLKLNRIPDADAVTMIVNHDHVMGSIPSKVFSELPSLATYELSVAYIIQRIYGNPLILPHDIQFPLVQRALQLRARMREAGIVQEYVIVNQKHITVDKLDTNGNIRFVVVINLDSQPLQSDYGEVPPLSFEWWNTLGLNRVYNNTLLSIEEK
jgi:hypothetical protein